MIFSTLGLMQAKSLNVALSERDGRFSSTRVADQPIPDPGDRNCPQLAMDQPIPDPDSKQCPL